MLQLTLSSRSHPSKKNKRFFLPLKNEGLDEDCDCPEEEEELSMMKTRNVAQKNASLCQEYASHLGLGGGGGGPEELGGEVFR